MTGDAQDSNHDAPWTLAQRLRSRRFIGQDAVDAIHGRKLPLHLGRPLVRCCVVRGIRHHLGFATGEAAVLKGVLPAFTAAINARLIMSNQIPDMNGPREMPYCIWHPDVPSEETLRQLAARYPDMRYHVGRSCAVAGYTALYKSLDILPEVAIAEEARESGSLEIFEHIMKDLVKWRVFDDYTGTLSAPMPSPLNGDTVVRSELEYTQGFEKPSGRMPGEDGDTDPDNPSEDDFFSMPLFGFSYGYNRLRHNVTGDQGLVAPDTWADMNKFLFNKPVFSFPVSKTALDLLSNPLPADLPTGDKDVLIVMAAYRGDLDRYCRLRRPYLVCGEFEAIIRGVYHSTQFAKWWSTQQPPEIGQASRIATAIVARFIMADDISWALTVRKGGFGHWNPDYPSLICFPDIANSGTYEALARAVPAMRPAVARAAIYGNLEALFDLVVTGPNNDFPTVTPNPTLYAEAMQSPEPHYRNILEHIARERGILDAIKKPSPDVPYWEQVSLRRLATHVMPSILYAEVYLWRDIVADSQDCETAIYNGVRCTAIGLERYLSLPEEWQPTAEDVDPSTGERDLDYKSWPPKFAELLKEESQIAKCSKQ